MTRINVMALALVVLVALVASACTDGTKEAYVTIATAAKTYDAVMTVAAEQYAAGRITAEQKDAVIRYGQAAYASLGIARQALETYIVVGESRDSATYEKLVSAVANLVANIADLKTYATAAFSIIEGHGQQEDKQ